MHNHFAFAGKHPPGQNHFDRGDDRYDCLEVKLISHNLISYPLLLSRRFHSKMDKSTTFGTSTFRKRALSFVLVLVMLLGLLPTTVLDATAADVPSQIQLVNAKYGYSQSGNNFVSYTSPNGSINNAYFHYFTMDVNGSVVPGLCLEHQKHMGVSYEGQFWEQPKLSTLPSGVLRFLDYYYYKVDEYHRYIEYFCMVTNFFTDVVFQVCTWYNG